MGIFGFIAVMATWLLSNEIFTMAQQFGLDNPGGFDTNTFNFFVALWGITGVLFFFAFMTWSLNQTQKDPSLYG